MKKIVFVATLLAMCVTAQAQIAAVPYPQDGSWQAAYTLKYTTAGDDTGTNTDVIQMGAIMNGQYDVVVKLVNTEVSGAPDGYAYIMGSADGVNYVVVKNSSSVITASDSLNIADGSQTYIWQVKNFPFKYLKLYCDFTGTHVSAPVGTLYYRKSEQ